MTVGVFDPDEPDALEPKNNPARNPKTQLQCVALEACGRKYFKDTESHRRFRLIEAKTFNASDEGYLHKAWVLHNIALCAQANSRANVRNFAILLKMCENESREIDWKACNRKRILETRGQDIIANFPSTRRNRDQETAGQ